MKLVWAPKASRDYDAWDDKTRERINELISDIKINGELKGVGRPERLKFAWSGWCSRRIIAEHRLVYRVRGKGDEAVLEIAQCRYHY